MSDALICEGCRGGGQNWDCLGENDPEYCNCENCTGNPNCPECGGEDEEQ